MNYCLTHFKDDIKCHLFELFIDFSHSIIAYYPPTFLNVSKIFLKSKQKVEEIQRFFTDKFSHEFYLDYYTKFDLFLQLCQKIC